MRWLVPTGTLLLLGVSLGMAADRTVELGRMRALYPGLETQAVGEQITRVYGTVFGVGDTPQFTAADFVHVHAAAFGVTPSDLRPGNPFNDQLTQPVMYDPATGTHKFTLVYYRQYVGDIPVYQAELRLLMRNERDYPLVLAASSLVDLGTFTLDPATVAAAGDTPAINAVVAREPTLINFSDRELVIWAGVEGQKATPTLAYTFVADNEGAGAELPSKYRFVCDAATGAILHEENLILFTDVTGSVNGMASSGPAADYCALEMPTPMPYAEVAISGGSTAYTDVNGSFTIPNGGSAAVTVSSYMGGRYFDVDNVAGAEETLTLSVTPPGPANFSHNQANTSEFVRAQVNGYIQANAVRDWVLEQNPNYPTISTQLNFPVYVNRTDGYCPGNAWYDGSSINFCQASGTYPNTAWSSVIHHEYGHHVTAMGGSGQGQYGEGIGDSCSTLILRDARLGLGFTGDCNTPLRNADNTLQYPCTDSIHTCGQLLSGCVWDTYEEMLALYDPATAADVVSNLLVNSVLVHTGTQITPQITTDFLVLDDDDGNLGNGTPHYAQITTAFALHNMWAGPPPANDPCSGAIAVCPGTPVTGNTNNASNDGSASCGTSSSTPDLWYSYTPATNGTLTASLCSGTSYDSVLSIHSACPGTSANELGCDDDGCGSTGGPSSVTISVNAWQTYYIRVTGYNGATGPFTLSVTGPACGTAPLIFDFPSGLPDAIPPGAPYDITVQIMNGSENYVAGSGRMYYRFSPGSFQNVTLVPLGGDLFRATLPAAGCSDTPEFYFTAQGDGGSTVQSPSNDVYGTLVGNLVVVMHDNFETNMGWTVTNGGGLTDGPWDRGIPVNCDRGDPPADYDGSGQCYLTDNSSASSCNSDVDGGYTWLDSPTLNLSSGDATVTYALWYTNNFGADPNNDVFNVFVSNNNGSSWTPVHTHGPTTANGWNVFTFNVGDYVTPTAQVKVRFEASDLGSGSVVEAGVDMFIVEQLTCQDQVGACCYADGSCSVTLAADCTGTWLGAGTTCSPNPCPTPGCPGDANCDDYVSWRDIDFFVAAMNDNVAAWEALFAPGVPTCLFANNDVNGDSTVNWRDIDALVALMNTPCP